MPRRQTRRVSLPNQRTCKHDFYRLNSLSEPSVSRAVVNEAAIEVVRGRHGVVLGCGKCGLTRCVWDDGTFADGAVDRIERQGVTGVAMGSTMTRTIATGGDMVLNPPTIRRTAAQRLDDQVDNGHDHGGEA